MRNFRIVSLTVAAALLLCVALCACGSSTSTTSTGENTNLSNGQLAESSGDIETIDVPFESETLKIDWGTALFSEPAETYNHDLAIAGLVMSAAANSSSETGDKINSLYKKLGFEYVYSGDYGKDATITGTTDWESFSPAHTMGIRKISIEGKAKYLIGITIRGTSDAGDVGTDVLSLFDGGSVSTKNVLNELNDVFMPRCVDKGYLPNDVDASDLVFFINGHSLGGGISNLLGQYFILNYPQTDCFVYSYAPIRTDSLDLDSPLNKLKLDLAIEGSGNIEDHSTANLMEIINTKDDIPDLPPNKQHVGNIFEFDGAGSAMRPFYKKLTGFDSGPKALVTAANEKSHHSVNAYMALVMANDSSRDWLNRIFDNEEAAAASSVSDEKDDSSAAETVGDFVIEGTWESVGDEGFGQAQPGSTVIFDGEYANFFSPCDTYTFKAKANGAYLLKATSYLTGETLKFSVDVKSNNRIKITHGDTVTILKRIYDYEETQEKYGDYFESYKSSDYVEGTINALFDSLKNLG